MTPDPRMTGLPADIIACVHAGARALRDGHPQHAEALLLDACRRAPDHPEPMRYLGILQLQTRRPLQALETFRQALLLQPDDAQLHSDLGTALAAIGEPAAAMQAWRHATQLDPGLAMAWFNLGRNFQQTGETEAAIAALEHGVRLMPQVLPPKLLLGDALTHAGRFAEATAHYRAALQLHPACGDAWRGLSNIKTVALDDADAALLRTQLQRDDIADSDRVAMGHALGKLEEDHGHPAAALAAFVTANALQQRMTPWRADTFRTFVAQALQASAHLPAPLDPSLGNAVIFIVGLPRSGSTLFEQILSAHPDVEGASELPDLGIVLQEESLRRGQPYPQWVPLASAQDWHRLGQSYLQRTSHWRKRRPRFTDKQPDNWKHVGILRAMLPGAHIIETRRDPLETAWSCFKQQFYSQPHFANDLAHIATYLQSCEQAMDHWRNHDPGHIHLHHYEALLAAPEAQTRILLEACDLLFDPACLAFHHNLRSVRTASAAQVRQPLQVSRHRAQQYGALLNPLRVALGLPVK